MVQQNQTIVNTKKSKKPQISKTRIAQERCKIKLAALHNEKTSQADLLAAVALSPEVNPACSTCRNSEGEIVDGKLDLGTNLSTSDGLPFQGKNGQEGEDQKENSDLKKQVQDVKEFATDYFHEELLIQLNDGLDEKEEVVENVLSLSQYLLQERKHSRETLCEFKVGFTNGRFTAAALAAGFNEAVIIRAGLTRKVKTKKGDLKLRDHWPKGLLVFPHYIKGRVSHFSQKCYDERNIVYQAKKEARDPACLFYNQDASDEATEIVLVEGENDLLSVAGKGDYENVMATIGGPTTKQIAFLKKLKELQKLVMLFDNDVAGRKYANKMRKAFDEVSRIRLVNAASNLANSKDIDDLLSQHLPPSTSPQAALADLLGAAKGHSPTYEGDPDVPINNSYRLARVVVSRLLKINQRLLFWQSQFWLYNGTRWANSAGDIDRKIAGCIEHDFVQIQKRQAATALAKGKSAPSRYNVTKNLVGNVKQALADLAGAAKDTELNTWLHNSTAPEQPAKCLSVKNGLLDLNAAVSNKSATRAKCLLPHNSNWFSLISLPYNYDPAARCPTWLHVVSENLEADRNNRKLQIVQEFAGYTIADRLSAEQKFMVFFGPAATGKSAVCGGLAALVGERNTAAIDLAALKNRFAMVATSGKLLNIASETDFVGGTNEELLKKITCGEAVTFEEKGQPLFRAVPTAKHVFAGNQSPRFQDRTDAIWRRAILLPFNQVITDNRVKKGLTSTKFWAESGELSGMLNWALAGAARLKRQGGFTRSREADRALRECRLDSNPAACFLEESCLAEAEAATPTNTLYEKYREWCATNGYSRPLGARLFSKEILRKFPRVRRQRGGTRQRRYYMYEGLLLTSNLPAGNSPGAGELP